MSQASKASSVTDEQLDAIVDVLFDATQRPDVQLALEAVASTEAASK